ncbi:MAG: sulfite exporter TauE/SafE family protein [Proteobacteria bacterium]|nr:sulfite exporter TauE/SafE family protein [Burkholderiales bacterium]
MAVRASLALIEVASAFEALAQAMPVSAPVLVGCVLTLFVAYLVFGVSGFGASLITIPVLSQVMPLPLLLSLAVVTDLAAATIVAAFGQNRGEPGPRTRPAIDHAELWRLGLPAVAGATVGVTLLVGMPRDASMFALGAFLLGYGAWSWRSRIPTAPLGARWSLPFGFAGGLLGALFGIGGPPYVIYLSRRIFDPRRLRATIAVVVLASLAIRFVVFLSAGLLMQPGLPAMLAVLLPVCVVSVLIGNRMFEHLSRERLHRVIASLLAVSGALLIVRTLLDVGP